MNYIHFIQKKNSGLIERTAAVVLSIFLLLTIITLLVSCSGFEKKEDKLPESIAKYIDEINRIVADTDSFYENPGYYDGIIADNLKMIITEGGEKYFQDGTLDSALIDFTIGAEIPVAQSTIRKIEFTLRNGEFGDSTRYFLQYGTDKPVFSPVEYSSGEIEKFAAFDTADGIIAFIYYEFFDNTESYASLIDWETNIFVVKDDKFKEITYEQIPHATANNNPDEVIDIKQDSGGIHAFLSEEDTEDDDTDSQQDSVAVADFDAATMSFVPVKANAVCNRSDVSITSGLLLGLSDEYGYNRTLWIRQKGNQIKCNEISGAIVIPQGEDLYSVKTASISPWSDIADSESYLYFSKLLYTPLGQENKAAVDFEQYIQHQKKRYQEGMDNSSEDFPLYVGNEYICYRHDDYYSGGGSFHENVETIRFAGLNDLDDYKLVEPFEDGIDADAAWLEPTSKQTFLADFVYGEKAKNFYRATDFQYSGIESQYIDFHDLAIMRNFGKWSIVMPVMNEVIHPGNGSIYRGIDQYADFSDDVPDALAPDSNRFDAAGDFYDATDVLKFPHDNVVLVQNTHAISVMNYSDDKDQSDDFDLITDDNKTLSVTIKPNDFIVSINWAEADEIARWDAEIEKVPDVK